MLCYGRKLASYSPEIKGSKHKNAPALHSDGASNQHSKSKFYQVMITNFFLNNYGEDGCYYLLHHVLVVTISIFRVTSNKEMEGQLLLPPFLGLLPTLAQRGIEAVLLLLPPFLGLLPTYKPGASEVVRFAVGFDSKN